MLLELDLGAETQQAREASKLMTNGVVILEVILQSPLVIECAQTQIAADLVAPRVLHVVFQAIAILEHALAQITVVLVI